MYDANYFFVANPINRYSISARQNLKTNTDGSVDLYIQNQSPGADKESNWLPAPKDKFVLMMRLYWPREKDPSLLDGSWKIPAAQPTGQAIQPTGRIHDQRSQNPCPVLQIQL